MRLGFTCGSYDLFHAGHVLALKDAYELCDYLIVGLQSDASVDRPNKNKPIQTVQERKIQLLACKYVNEVWVYDTEEELYKYLQDNERKIDVRFLGEDWKGKQYTGRDLDIKCWFTQRRHNWSSSELRRRISSAIGEIHIC